MKKKYITIAIIAVAIVGSTIGFCLFKKSLDSRSVAKPQYFKVDSAEKVFINGVLSPKESENVYIDATKGQVSETHVENGQVVKKGDNLFSYYNETVADQIEQLSYQITSNENTKQSLNKKIDTAKANIGEIQNQINNISKQNSTVEGQGSNNQATVGVEEQLKAQIQGYEEQIDAYTDQVNATDLTLSSLYEQSDKLKENQSFTVIAPIDGKVTISDDKKNYTLPYIVIESEELVVLGTVSERDYSKIKVEDPIEVTIVASDKVVDGKVSLISDRPISNQISAVSQSVSNTGNTTSSVSYYDVKITLNSQDGLINGFHSQGKITLGSDVIKVPQSAIIKENDKNYVFVNRESILRKIEVTTGEVDGENIIIQSGLNSGDSVMDNPTNDTKDGTKVE